MRLEHGWGGYQLFYGTTQAKLNLIKRIWALGIMWGRKLASFSA